ncbi:MAG: hypothetical protein Q9N02_01045 [Ghiorsea sp.]|nr:hypothetical protein [Ghiorsea sp.]
MTEHTQANENTAENEQAVLQHPDHPEIYFFQYEDSHAGEAVREMFDAVVRKVYADKRHINWLMCTPETDVGSDVLGFDIELAQHHANTVVCSAIILLKHLGWDDAAQLLHAAMFEVLTQQTLPEDMVLHGIDGQLPSIEYYAAITQILANNDKIEYAKQTKHDAQAHSELTDTLHDVFDGSAEKTAEFAHVAMEKAREQGGKIKTFVENDFSRLAKEKLNPSRLATGALASVSTLMHVTGLALSKFADKADDALSCKSGEVTDAGHLVCKACGYDMHFKKTGAIPPCPKCHETEFKKRY